MADVIREHVDAGREGEGPKARIAEHRISCSTWPCGTRGWARPGSEIVRRYPATTIADTHAALTCWDHRERIGRALVEEKTFIEEVRRGHVDSLQKNLKGPRPLVYGAHANEADSLARVTQEL